MLLAHVLGVDRAHLHAHPETPVESVKTTRYRELVARRAAREPLQYLTGVQEFWSLAFTVTPAVLIPRPETEGIIEAFLRLNQRSPEPVVLDIGTGCGFLAIVVAREVSGARVYAGDISPEALRVARGNAATHGVGGQIDFRCGDLFEPLRATGLEGAVDFVLANPPYLGDEEMERLMPEVRDYEPRSALVAGRDALAVHRRLARDASGFLKPGGHLIAEIGLGQDGPLRNLYGDPARFDQLTIEPDLAGIPRVLIARTR